MYLIWLGVRTDKEIRAPARPTNTIPPEYRIPPKNKVAENEKMTKKYWLIRTKILNRFGYIKTTIAINISNTVKIQKALARTDLLVNQKSNPNTNKPGMLVISARKKFVLAASLSAESPGRENF
ncbi:hypothetical protein [Maribellus mangrovi]|uniref:hypothetical protein n=1 Tax=Maribellus mangrovi TaxID=3133146 RepID=UPI0030EE62BA